LSISNILANNVLEYEVGAYNEVILDKYNQKTNNLFSISSQNSDRGLHPTQKPLKLMELLIELTTKEEQIVL
jgi:site-specific DNA-methyltransferase (adenine-specific)